MFEDDTMPQERHSFFVDLLGATLTLMEAERSVTRLTRDSFWKHYSAVNVIFLPLEYVQRVTLFSITVPLPFHYRSIAVPLP